MKDKETLLAELRKLLAKLIVEGADDYDKAQSMDTPSIYRKSYAISALEMKLMAAEVGRYIGGIIGGRNLEDAEDIDLWLYPDISGVLMEHYHRTCDSYQDYLYAYDTAS